LSPTQTTEEPDWPSLEQVGEATTAVDGSYKVQDLPPGDYYVLADGSPIAYGDAWSTATVATGDTTTVNFALGAADGTLVAEVTAADGSPIANALVEVTDGTTIVGSGVTNEDGKVEFSVQPGDYQAQAKAAGYAASVQQSVEIESNQKTEPPVAFELQREPEGAITGKIVGSASGAPVGGVTIRLLSNNVDVLAPVISTETLIDPGDGGASYNFRFDSVPTGTLVVKPDPIGFTATPTQQTVTVTSGETTENVSFVLTSLHTLPAGLQLVSTPYDYANTDPTALLGVAANDLLMATWQASQQRYRLYPQAPADRFRLGTGYWLRLASSADITLQGTDSADPAYIDLKAGWNLVGDPFPETVDFFTARVRYGETEMTMQQALAAAKIEGGMYAYTLGGYQNTSVFLPWVGTWLKASQDLTLEVSAEQGALSSLSDAKPAVVAPEGGWLASLETRVDGLADSSCHFGVADNATDGHDAGLDCAKPPVPDFSAYVYTSLGEKEATAYAVDVRDGDAQAVEWPLTVRTNMVGSTVTLRWPDLAGVPRDARPYLFDEATGKSVYMRTTGSYSFRAGVEPRELRIVMEVGAIGALAITGVKGEQVGAEKVQFAYTLSTAAAVDIEVLNIAGRAIRTLGDGGVQGKGVHSVVWDGRNAGGVRAPAGRYIVKLTARADDGQQASAITSVGLRR